MTTPGPRLRTNVVDVYVFRRTPAIELLQVRRAREPMLGGWHPVMGHVEAGETAVQTARREINEELGLDKVALLGFWAMEQVHPFYMPDRDEIMLSPRFAAEVGPEWSPVLNDEHDAHRWIRIEDAPGSFIWPGQLGAIRELQDILTSGKDDRFKIS